MSINTVVISGNLTRDAEGRSTASGMYALGLGVAVNDRRKNPETGEWEDYPNYIDCAMFGSRADSLSKYLVKGTKVVIAGKLRWSQWERDGQKRSKVSVIVDDIDFMTRSGFVRQHAVGADQGAGAQPTGFTAFSGQPPQGQDAGTLDASRPLVQYAQPAAPASVGQLGAGAPLDVSAEAVGASIEDAGDGQAPPAAGSAVVPSPETAPSSAGSASAPGAPSSPGAPGEARPPITYGAPGKPDVADLYDEEIPF